MSKYNRFQQEAAAVYKKGELDPLVNGDTPVPPDRLWDEAIGDPLFQFIITELANPITKEEAVEALTSAAKDLNTVIEAVRNVEEDSELVLKAEALNKIFKVMDGRQWDSDTTQEIADIRESVGMSPGDYVEEHV